MKSRIAGFTLLEMIVVLVIIGLIMGLVGPRLFGQADNARVQTAETQVKMLKGALQTMRLDISRFPSTDEGLELLNTRPSDPALARRWRGPYLEEPVPNDPWDRPYVYRGEAGETQGFVLYSYGADGQAGGEDLDADIGYLPAR
jgi:general secretion pathway protein G